MRSNDRSKPPISKGEADRRAEQRRQALLSRDEIEAEYKGITRRWLELAALSGNGPPMIRISSRMIRYQRGAFEVWLAARTVTSTSETVEAG